MDEDEVRKCVEDGFLSEADVRRLVAAIEKAVSAAFDDGMFAERDSHT
jgi:hypothetical protein